MSACEMRIVADVAAEATIGVLAGLEPGDDFILLLLGKRVFEGSESGQ